jgi:arylsulfatase A-like enzyme
MRQRLLRFGITGAVVAVVWVIVAQWLGPSLIVDAYNEESLPLLNRALSGRAIHPLGYYLSVWASLTSRLGVGLLAAGLAILVWIIAHPFVAPMVERLFAGRPQAGPGDLLLFAGALGTLSGAAEVTHETVRHLIEQHPARGYTWETTWMGPSSAAVAFLIVGVAMLVAGRLLTTARSRWRVPADLAAFGLGFLASFSVLESPRLRLHRWATVVLCLGLATLLTRVVRAHPETVRRFTRRLAPVLAIGLVVLTGVGLYTLPGAKEARRMAGLTSGREAQPNVLLIVLDTVRALSLSLHGYEKATTPRMDEWASEGVVFARAIATSSWTLPSHSSLFTGYWPHDLTGDRGVPLDDAHATLAEALSERGYQTAAFVANLDYASEASGLARGFARYEDFPVTWGRFLVSSWLMNRMARRVLDLGDHPWRAGLKYGASNTNDFIAWLDGRVEAPFFVFMNYFDAHVPYLATDEFKARFPSETPPLLRHKEGVTMAELDGTRALYDASIATADHEVDRVLRELERRGELERTLVIVTSDHGEHMGENGLQDHGNSLYSPLVHVPLFVRFPRVVPADTRIDAPVSIREVPATVMDLIGAASPFPGRSLSRFWTEGGVVGPEAVLAEVSYWPDAQPWEPVFEGDMQSVVVGDYHYIVNPDQSGELYDLTEDPMELNDLAGDPTQGARMRSLRTVLDSLLVPESEGSASGSQRR